MTQEYTPTDNDVKADYIRAFCSARNTRNWSENSAKGEREFNRWLAAHDAQIRAEALNLTDAELDRAVTGYTNMFAATFDGYLAMQVAISDVQKKRNGQES